MEKGRLAGGVDKGSGIPKKVILEEAEASLSWTSKIKLNLKVQGHIFLRLIALKIFFPISSSSIFRIFFGILYKYRLKISVHT